jgi:hypothetical protein
MIGDGILTLIESGAVTNRRKNYLPGKSVATFALGSSKLYRFMDRNLGLEIHPSLHEAYLRAPGTRSQPPRRSEALDVTAAHHGQRSAGPTTPSRLL